MSFESHGQLRARGTDHLLGGFAVLLHTRAPFPPPVRLGLELRHSCILQRALYLCLQFQRQHDNEDSV